MNILDLIAEKTKQRVALARAINPDPYQVLGGEPVLRRCDIPRGVNTMEPFAFEKALRKTGVSFITEVKKASPSKGVIAREFPYVDIAVEYDNAGADAISCLTEPYWFMGRNEYLTEIRRATDIPILRKDFIVDEYMIHEAKAIGADAVLLICSILDYGKLRYYLEVAKGIGLSAVVEAHDAAEIEMASKAGAGIIGVNNRNLKDFTVNTENAGTLRNLVPEGTLFVSESGVRSRRDIEIAERICADAVLVGETMMRAGNKSDMLMELKGARPKVKICGMMEPCDIAMANELKPDYVGMVFAPTRHRLSAEKAASLKAGLDPKIAAVGVFVDSDPGFVISLLNRGIIDMAQLHGDETDDDIEEIKRATGKKVIKAIILKSEEDMKKTDLYPSADYLLFDAGKGSGLRFNWELLKARPGKPFFLAGGLDSSNVDEGIRAVQPFGVDVSSAVERPDLTKDRDRTKTFIERVRNGE